MHDALSTGQVLESGCDAAENDATPVTLTDHDTWRQDAVLHAIDLTAIDLLSLDIFDTLLLRACHVPADVFLLVGEQAQQAGLLDAGLPPPLFARMRAEMEKRARLKKKGRTGSIEVTIEEIYREFPAGLGDARTLLAVELAVEGRVLFANPYVLSLVRAARAQGCRVCLVSDMYLRHGQILDLLSGAGIDPGLFDAVFVSCEAGASKHAGDLFGIVRQWAGDTARILHVGDNAISDCRRANERGIPALLYRPPHPSTLTGYQETMLGFPSRPSVLSSLRLLGRFSNRHDDPRDAFFHDFGATILGPALVEFCRWVVDDCLTHGIRTIFPLMREGAIFADYMTRHATTLGADLTIVPLYMSRRSTFLASLDDFDDKALDSFFTRRTYTVRDLLEELGVAPLLERTFSSHIDTPLMAADTIGWPDGGTLRTALGTCLRAPEIRPAIEREIQASRARVNDYVMGVVARGRGDCHRIATVDLGAAGSTQYNMVRALRHGGRPVPRVSCYLMYGSRALVERGLDDIDYRVFFGWEPAALQKMQVIYRSPEIFEQFLVGTEETTLSYRRKPDGSVVPVTDGYRMDGAQRRAIACFRQGVDAWWDHSRDIRSRHGVKEGAGEGPFGIPPADLLDILYRCVEFPTPQEAEYLGSLAFDDNFGSSGIRRICDQAMVEQVRSAPAGLFYRQYRMGRLGGHVVPWPQGCLTLAYPDFLFCHHHFHLTGSHQALVAAELIQKLAAEGIGRLIVYGAGEIGQQLVSVLASLKFHCVCVVDRNRDLHGQTLSGVPIVSLAASLDFDCDAIAVASVAFQDEIVRDIGAVYHAAGRPARIIRAG